MIGAAWSAIVLIGGSVWASPPACRAAPIQSRLRGQTTTTALRALWDCSKPRALDAPRRRARQNDGLCPELRNLIRNWSWLRIRTWSRVRDWLRSWLRTWGRSWSGLRTWGRSWSGLRSWRWGRCRSWCWVRCRSWVRVLRLLLDSIPPLPFTCVKLLLDFGSNPPLPFTCVCWVRQAHSKHGQSQHRRQCFHGRFHLRSPCSSPRRGQRTTSWRPLKILQ